MTTKQIIIAGSLALLVAFAAGRWSSPEKVITKTVEVEKKTENKQVVVDDHKKTTIVEVTKPDGTKTKKTVITDNRDTKVDDKKTDDITKSTTKEIDRSTSKVTVLALASMNITSPGVPIFGAAITKPILGPITVGIFGFQNGVIGASIGLTF